MILSVPHSGTRSLVRHLHPDREITDGNFTPVMLHFGMHEHWGDHYEHVDIPIRDPFDVAVSWQARYGEVTQDSTKWPAQMLRIMNLMVTYPRVEDPVYAKFASPNPDVDITYWDIREIGVHEGASGDHPAKEDKEYALTLERPAAVVEWYNSNQYVRDFYAPFFPDGFWWA